MNRSFPDWARFRILNYDNLSTKFIPVMLQGIPSIEVMYNNVIIYAFDNIWTYFNNVNSVGKSLVYKRLNILVLRNFQLSKKYPVFLTIFCYSKIVHVSSSNLLLGRHFSHWHAINIQHENISNMRFIIRVLQFVYICSLHCGFTIYRWILL